MSAKSHKRLAKGAAPSLDGVLDAPVEAGQPAAAAEDADADADAWLHTSLRPLILPYKADREAAAATRRAAGGGDAFDDEEDDAVVAVGALRRRRAEAGPAAAAASSASSLSTAAVVRAAAAAAAAEEDEELPATRAASAFVRGSGLVEGRLLHISLPATLPLRRKPSSASSSAGAAATAAAAAEALSAGLAVTAPRPGAAGLGEFALPGRLLGRLRIHASGRVKMEIGGLLFDISNGLRRQEYEQVVATTLAEGAGADAEGVAPPDGKRRKSSGTAATTAASAAALAFAPGAPDPPPPLPAHYVVLGKVDATLVVTPDLENMVAELEVDTASRAERLVRAYSAMPRRSEGIVDGDSEGDVMAPSPQSDRHKRKQ